MLLSLVVPAYRNDKNLGRFLRRLSKQTTPGFGVVFVVDTNKENVVSVIEEYLPKIKAKVTFVYNSSRVGRTQAIKKGLGFVKSKYSLVVSYSDHFKDDFVEKSLKTLKNHDADIIEFNPVIEEPFSFEGRNRQVSTGKLTIVQKPAVVAYTYPFDFNKFFKTSLLRSALDKKLNVIINSRFSIEFVYLATLLAKDYVYVNKNLVFARIELSFWFNPLRIMKQWMALQHFVKQKDTLKRFTSEIEYANLFYNLVFIFALTKKTKNKTLMKKVYTNFKGQLKNEFKTIFSTNPYFLNNKNEKFLNPENLTISKMTKLYKKLENATKK